MTGHNSRVLHLAQSPDGVTVCSAAADETLRFWKCFAEAAPAKVGAALISCSTCPPAALSTTLQSTTIRRALRSAAYLAECPTPLHSEADFVYCISVQVSERSRLPAYTVLSGADRCFGRAGGQGQCCQQRKLLAQRQHPVGVTLCAPQEVADQRNACSTSPAKVACSRPSRGR